MSLYVVVAMCVQLSGMEKPVCSPYNTDKNIYTSPALCDSMAEYRYQERMQEIKKQTAQRGQNLKRVAVYSKCLTPEATIKLLESPESSGLNL